MYRFAVWPQLLISKAEKSRFIDSNWLQQVWVDKSGLFCLWNQQLRPCCKPIHTSIHRLLDQTGYTHGWDFLNAFFTFPPKGLALGLRLWLANLNGRPALIPCIIYYWWNNFSKQQLILVIFGTPKLNNENHHFLSTQNLIAVTPCSVLHVCAVHGYCRRSSQCSLFSPVEKFFCLAQNWLCKTNILVPKML